MNRLFRQTYTTNQWCFPGEKSPDLTVVALTQDNLRRLHSLVVAEGRIEMSDYGDAENGPNYHYGGHHWGRLTAFANHHSAVYGRDNTVYTDLFHIAEVLKEADAVEVLNS